MEWVEFAAGAGSAVLVGAILALVKSRLSAEERKLSRQLEVAEMVGAVRTELRTSSAAMASVLVRLEGIDRGLRSLDDKLDAHISSGIHVCGRNGEGASP